MERQERRDPPAEGGHERWQEICRRKRLERQAVSCPMEEALCCSCSARAAFGTQHAAGKTALPFQSGMRVLSATDLLEGEDQRAVREELRSTWGPRGRRMRAPREHTRGSPGRTNEL
ncbi:hypothetical protein NDU88_011120 [Pleurodeles waltl]|uniref:Uncharacterized protein n=1 Tax=Pleurodeles waltl TaxID=8319 RepID=A0AAV7QWM1_PLEWA|nr:hypothetical protein NDU88_011120 [Pleurodeles waltl]